jgi:hypothetical protein
MPSRLEVFVGQKAQEPGAHDARLPVQPSAALSLSFVNEG